MERRLTTILAVDVVGYSRLMGRDEGGTLAALQSHRSELIDPAIAANRGRMVKLMGDGALVEFASVVDAVSCALSIQRGMKTRNQSIDEKERIVFRIGVHLDDVIVDGDDLYGDGVNIAARLEGLAEPGGICISQQVLDQVAAKLPLAYEDMGERDLKNIEKAIRVYRLRTDAEGTLEPASARKGMPKRWRWAALAAAVAAVGIGGAAIWMHSMRPSGPLAERSGETLRARTAIAVLPFVNRSADPEQDYFADGITEDLITDLAKFPELEVTARTSTSAYKGKPVDVRKISEELGVQYLVAGSVEKSAAEIRITAQLIDAATGSHIWAERYDRELTDLFAVRDEIREAIIGAMTGYTGPLIKSEIEKAGRKSPGSAKARDLYYQAFAEFSKFEKEANARARDLLKRSIALDPEDAAAFALLAWTHWRDNWIGWGDPVVSRDLAIEAAETAVALDSSNYRGHWALGAALRLRGDFEAAAVQYDRAFKLNSNNPDMLADWGEFLRDSGEVEKAIEHLRRAIELNPNYPDWYAGVLAGAYLYSGQYEAAIRTTSRMTDPDSDNLADVAVSYVKLDRMEEARAEIEKILEADPDYSISKYLEWPGWEKLDPRVVESYADALRQAGLPE